jgi:shikimate 5-dehydrogenase
MTQRRAPRDGLGGVAAHKVRDLVSDDKGKAVVGDGGAAAAAARQLIEQARRDDDAARLRGEREDAARRRGRDVEAPWQRLRRGR